MKKPSHGGRRRQIVMNQRAFSFIKRENAQVLSGI